MIRLAIMSLIFLISALAISVFSQMPTAFVAAAPVPKEFKKTPYTPKNAANRDCSNCADCTYMAYFFEENQPVAGPTDTRYYKYMLKTGMQYIDVYNALTPSNGQPGPPPPAGITLDNWVTDLNDCTAEWQLVTVENESFVVVELLPLLNKACLSPNQLAAIQANQMRRWEAQPGSAASGLPPYPEITRRACKGAKNTYPNP